MEAPSLSGWKDEELVLISAIEHWSYCPRQCALIHLDQTWDENLYTPRGRMIHDRADEPRSECKGGVRIERALSVWSMRAGLVGKADLVEFRGAVPYPVEYKHGPKRRWGHEDLQLCAQALCLEEMMSQEVARGAIYYHRSRRRREVVFDGPLRSRTLTAVTEIRRMMTDLRLPVPVNDARCRHCSLDDSCLPSIVGDRERLRLITSAVFTPIEE